MGGSYSTIDDPSGTIPFTIDNVVGDSTYLIPLPASSWASTWTSNWRIDMTVWWGHQHRILASATIILFSNSNVRGYPTCSSYTGPYIFWGHDAMVNPGGNLESLVESESGATRLEATTAP